MSVYSIRDLERISNQKAHTIRIWEQRYGLLVPERTDTNIRFYNDDQLKKLLNVCTLIHKGMKISNISKLSKKEIADEIDLILTDTLQGDLQIEAIISQALIAIATFDGMLFDQLFSNSVNQMGLNKTYFKIIYPLLVRTGLMWIKDDLIPSQEHFLSNLIRQKLFAAIESLPVSENPDQTWILFLNEEEDHEIGLLFAYYVLRQSGKKVIYLGSRVPYQDLFHVIAQCKPTHIYSFFVRNQPEKELKNVISRLTTDFKECSICISGDEEMIRKAADEKKVHRITTVDDLIDIVNKPNEL